MAREINCLLMFDNEYGGTDKFRRHIRIPKEVSDEAFLALKYFIKEYQNAYQNALDKEDSKALEKYVNKVAMKRMRHYHEQYPEIVPYMTKALSFFTVIIEKMAKKSEKDLKKSFPEIFN